MNRSINIRFERERAPVRIGDGDFFFLVQSIDISCADKNVCERLREKTQANVSLVLTFMAFVYNVRTPVYRLLPRICVWNKTNTCTTVEFYKV